MVKVGELAPDVVCDALVEGQIREGLRLSDYRGKWVLLYFYPLDFTFVCPTEIASFNEHTAEFERRDCQLLTCSTDSCYSHLGWTQSHPALRHMRHPMLGDTSHAVAEAFGVLIEDKGIALRGSFLIDPEGIVRSMTVNDLPVGRSVEEALRLLDAFRTGELTPCDWKPGEPTLVA